MRLVSVIETTLLMYRIRLVKLFEKEVQRISHFQGLLNFTLRNRK